MAILRIDCGESGLLGAPLPPASACAGRTLVMIHGYRYAPGDADACPHASLYGADAPPARLSGGGRVISWPQALGVSEADLCVAYGWRARASHVAQLLRTGRNGFAAVYDAAGAAGAALAPALADLGRARAAPVDMIAHSLGARVALSAVRALAEAGRADALARLGRMVLLAPAAFAGEARATLDACARIGARTPEVCCVLSRANAPFDALFAMVAPSGQGAALGRDGLGARRRGWIDLAFDDPALIGWAAARGVTLAPPAPGPCHWSVYARPGAMDLHRAILSRAPGFGPEEMRASGAPLHAPRPRLARWRRPDLAADGPTPETA